MPGIINATNVSLADVNEIVNVSSLHEFFIKVNHDIYGGWLFFVLLALLWIVLFYTMQSKQDQLLNNMMYAGAAVSVLSIILRGIYIVREGAIQGLLSDQQLWIFPILTILIAAIVWATND